MKQSAVEWLVEQIETLIKNGYVFNPKFEEDFIEQAKEMEKQQMREMYLKGIENYDPTFKNK